MTLRRPDEAAVPAPYALPAAFAALFLAVGTAAAALHGRLPGTGVLIAAAVVVACHRAGRRADRPPSCWR